MIRDAERRDDQAPTTLNEHKALRVLASFGVVVMLSACAGPKFVKQCNELATSCSALLSVCTQKTLESSLQRIQVDTCNAENERLTMILLNEKPTRIEQLPTGYDKNQLDLNSRDSNK